MHTLDACKTDGRESQSIEAEASNFIQKLGGEMLRSTKQPSHGNSHFASFLLQGAVRRQR
jgi:hypothetical protein